MSRLKSAMGFLGGLLTALGLLLGIVWLGGTNGWFLTRLMVWSAPSAATGLPEADYAPVGQMTADYLGERREPFQYWLRLGGSEYPCFTATEQQHMIDCRRLFRLCWQAALLLTTSGLALSLSMQRRRMTGAGFLAALGLGLILVLWGLLDFEGLFVRFHLLAFSNLLWVLDPANSLLIRLMPTGFFTRCAGIMGGLWLLLCLGAGLLCLRRQATE